MFGFSGAITPENPNIYANPVPQAPPKRTFQAGLCRSAAATGHLATSCRATCPHERVTVIPDGSLAPEDPNIFDSARRLPAIRSLGPRSCQPLLHPLRKVGILHDPCQSRVVGRFSRHGDLSLRQAEAARDVRVRFQVG